MAVLTKAVQVQNRSFKAEMKAKDAKIADMEAKISKLMMLQERMAQTMDSRLMQKASFVSSTANH